MLFALLVLAGCAGFGGAPVPDDATTTAPTTTDPMPGNPWDKETLVVGVNNTGSPDRDFAPQVQAALDYWETNRDAAAYGVTFRLDPDASDPDVSVEFQSDVVCGNETHGLGCAPVIAANDSVSGPITVEIETGYTDDSTVHILKHEFGHVLGLTHDDEPQAVMAATYRPTYLSLPDATEREWPWRVHDINVYVDYENVPASDRDVVREQVRHALDYYESDADGLTPDNLTLTLVENRSRAHVNVTFPADSPCGRPPVSCGANGGYDLDTDDALEYYSGVRIAMVDIPPEATGWHVAYWLGFAFGAETESELPPPLQDQSNADDPWWRR